MSNRFDNRNSVLLMKVLMVCLGNICRSPLAHGILEKKIAEKKLDWQVDSAGTSGFHNGEPPHRDSIAIAAAHDIDIKGQRSRLFVQKDFQDFDLILAMDTSNYNHILRLTRNENDADKVKMILNYSHPGQNRAVPDPYYEGGFDGVFDMLEEACEAFLSAHLE